MWLPVPAPVTNPAATDECGCALGAAWTQNTDSHAGLPLPMPVRTRRQSAIIPRWFGAPAGIPPAGIPKWTSPVGIPPRTPMAHCERSRDVDDGACVTLSVPVRGCYR